jgi:predicted DNA-binding protein
MLHVSLNEEAEATLRRLAERVGETPEAIAGRALVACLEELEDYADAVEAVRSHDPATSVSLDQLIARYGLEG